MNNRFRSSGNFFKKGIFIFIVIIGISFQSGYVQASSSDAWYDSSWAYRKEISVSGNGTALTDYPIRMTVSYAAGKMNADFSDLRFIGADGATVYSYYIESKTDSVSAVVSVRVDSLPAAGKVFYMYYGNSGASSLSSGDDTFPIFDHFDDGSIGAEWTVVNPDGNQTITESGTSVSMTTDAGISNLDISTGNQDAPRIIQSISGNFVVETKISTTNAAYDLTGILLWKDAQNFYVFGKGLMNGNERIWRRKNIADVITDTAYGSTAYTPDTVYLRMARSGTTVTCFYSSDNATWTQAFSETFASTDPLSIGFVRFDTTNRTYSGSADWFLAKEYAAPEPEYWYDMEEFRDPFSLTDWQYRKIITINHEKVNGSLIDFPLLINLSADIDLASRAQINGSDIIFTSSDVNWRTANSNDKLAHEIEEYNSNTGALQAWVKIPALSATTDTIIYMYYGNSNASNQQNKNAVWDANFKLIQHMNQNPGNPSPQMFDSTLNLNNGISNGAMSMDDLVDGEIGKAVDFDGSNDFLNLGYKNSLNITKAITIETWIKALDAAAVKYIISKYSYNLQINSNETISFVTRRADNVSFDNFPATLEYSLVPGDWYHVVGTFNPTANQKVLYVNGEVGDVTLKNDGGLPSSPGTFLAIGKYCNGDSNFGGIIDEVRISSSARSAEWIATEYSNQSSPSTFLSLSLEQSFMDHFVISGSAAQTAGASQAVTVTAINAYGSVNVEYSGDRTITFTGANSIGAHIPTFADKNGAEVQFGSSGSLSFVNGVATTSIKLYKSENISIDATDGIYDSAGNSSYDLDVAVNPAALNSFDVVFPASITSEASFLLAITSQDAYSNPTASVADPVLLSVNSGAIDVSSIASSEFSDDAVYAANVTISEIYEDKNVIFTLRNGAITQTFNIFITGVSRGSAFVPPAKPSIKNITVTVLDDGSIDFTDVPVEITQFSVSDNSSFQNSSWERLEDKGSIIKKYRTASTLYLRFRSREGGVSDTLIIHPLQEGDIVKTPHSFDVYIIKYQGGKAYKRLILSPQVFNSYRHLRWENLKTVSQEQLDRYATSNLVYVKGDSNIYALTPQGDTGRRRAVDLQREEIDRDSVYEINEVDRESYELAN